MDDSPKIERLFVSCFRNLFEQQILLSSEGNVFFGRNGQGKTNILEAIYFISNIRPIRSSRICDLIMHNCDQAKVKATVKQKSFFNEMEINIGRKKKKLFINRKQIHNARDYLGILKSVAFTPDDLNLVKGNPDARRRFLDKSAFLINPGHLRLLSMFRLALKSRNHLLMSGDNTQLEGFTRQLAWYGSSVSENREKIADLLENMFRKSETGKKKKSLLFRRGWRLKSNGGFESLLAQLNESVKRDKLLGRTGPGPQRDDLEILIDEQPATRFASQGEQRECSIDLLLALVEILKKREINPIVLLDDVSSELDYENREKVIQRMKGLKTQIFVTTTDLETVRSFLSEGTSVFMVENGQVLKMANVARKS